VVHWILVTVLTLARLKAILAEFPRIRVLVVGDFCLDRWCVYDPDLAVPSRETGIPRTAVVSYEVTPGGGGTVTNNLVRLGAGRVDVVAVAGDDANGFELERALRRNGIETRHLVRDPARQTFTYTKLLNRQTGVEDLPRLDFVNTAPPSPEAERAMIEAIQATAPQTDVVLVADQSEIASGAAVTGAVRQAVIEAAERFPAKIFMADSRAQVEKFRGLIVKPNEDEAIEAAVRINAGAAPCGSVEHAGAILRWHLGGNRPLYVTRGAAGVLLFENDTPKLVPARRNNHPVDICGAGDAFEAGLALALAATQRLDGRPDYFAAAEVGHLVAAVTITKKGTGTASPAEVLALL
jgi:rfaE bifunctional protein kinase chain/domain